MQSESNDKNTPIYKTYRMQSEEMLDQNSTILNHEDNNLNLIQRHPSMSNFLMFTSTMVACCTRENTKTASSNKHTLI